jgi:hypothetical protein
MQSGPFSRWIFFFSLPTFPALSFSWNPIGRLGEGKCVRWVPRPAGRLRCIASS